MKLPVMALNPDSDYDEINLNWQPNQFWVKTPDDKAGQRSALSKFLQNSRSSTEETIDLVNTAFVACLRCLIAKVSGVEMGNTRRLAGVRAKMATPQL